MTKSSANWKETLATRETRIIEQFEHGLGAMLDRKVKIDCGTPHSVTPKKIEARFPNGQVVVSIPFKGGDLGMWHFLLEPSAAAAIADLSVKGEGDARFDEETHVPVIADVLGQLVSAVKVELQGMLKTEVTVDPGIVDFDIGSVATVADPRPAVEWKIDISGWGETTILKILDVEIPGYIPDKEDLPKKTKPTASAKKTQDEKPAVSKDMDDTTVAQPAMFEDFGDDETELEPGQMRNLDMLLDINLPITIELGRTNMLIRDILNLGTGSVIELDKLSGEPVDLYANNKLFARGEVVVIDENFGVRITELLKVDERIKALK